MGWEDEAFIVFLVGGLVILAIFMLMFGPQSFVSEVNNNNTNSARNTYSYGIEDSNLIRAEVVKVLNSRIDTEYAFNTRTINLGSKYLQNGLLFGSNDITYNIDSSDINRARLSFDVSKTNSYNELIINVNGKTIARNIFQPGHYELELTGYSTNMKLEIFALSSDWRIWAPTVYDLKNVKITTNQYSVKSDSFDFVVLDNEFRNFKEGRIEFALSDYIGSMEVRMNGRTIFSGILKSTDSIRFDRDDMKLGLNTISFSSNLNSRYSGMIRTMIFYDLEGSSVKMSIDLSQKEYDELNEVRLSFRIQGDSGTFSIKTVNEAERTVTRNMPIENTNYMFVLDKSYLKPGVNDVVFESKDSFDIKNLIIEKV